MGKSQAIAKYQRSISAGALAPDALKTATTLALMFQRFRKRSQNTHSSGTKTSDVELLVVLYLWLTQQLSDLESADDIPDLKRISSSQACQPNCLRIIKSGNGSWCEYTIAYKKGRQIRFLWQPMPVALNALFLPYVSKKAPETPWLSNKQKQHLFERLQRKWKTPKPLQSLPRERKDRFFSYFTQITQVDPLLSALGKKLLLTERQAHHRSATAYQREDSEQLRFRIFHAQTRYCERIINAARTYQLHESLSCTIQGKRLCFIHSQTHLPPYLSGSDRIIQYSMNTNNGNRQLRQDTPMFFGSRRNLNDVHVTRFFHNLHQHIATQKPAKRHSLEIHIAHHNLKAYELALLFVLLTGTRPTHAITLERRRIFGRYACVRDKGRLRQIYLCDYLLQKIDDYLAVQTPLLEKMGRAADSTLVWYLIDSDTKPSPLTAKRLRTFMAEHWSEPVALPYQFRHFFAQCALTSINPHLSTLQIDRLMGHSQFGEHLGSDHLFPVNQQRLHEFLNHLPIQLKLPV